MQDPAGMRDAVRRGRARRLAPEDRRDAIIAATRPLLYAHGRDTTTKVIAEAAGIAEGTIFRSFATKDELFDAVIEQEFDPGPFFEALAGIDLDQSLERRLVEAVGLLQRRFVRIFQLMIALGVRKPPP